MLEYPDEYAPVQGVALAPMDAHNAVTYVQRMLTPDTVQRFNWARTSAARNRHLHVHSRDDSHAASDDECGQDDASPSPSKEKLKFPDELSAWLPTHAHALPSLSSTWLP